MNLELLNTFIVDDTTHNYAYYSKYSLGYQLTQNSSLLQINNAGDPYAKSYWQLTSHDDERYVVNWFAYLLKFIKPWGYCSTGSTESILCALWCARKRYPKAKIYASKDAHFCIRKCADILCIEYVEIPTLHGSIDIDTLLQSISDENIVVLTMGTTINGAYDNIGEFYEKLSIFKSKTHTDPKFHIHLDAAFGGMIYPFICPDWLDYHIDTINISLHKFIGVPIPCSLFLIREDLKKEISYSKCAGAYGCEMVCIPDKDFCVSCSRSGLSVLLVKKYLEKFNEEEHIHNIMRLFRLKEYFMDNDTISALNPITYPLSLSVVFDLPDKTNLQTIEIIKKYSLSEHYNKTHIYFCKHVDKQLIDEFINDVKKLNLIENETDLT